MQLTSKQRAFLRAKATTEDTIFQIGKGGISEEMLRQISNTLDARELIKLRVLDNAEYTAREAAELVAEGTASAVVTVIGTKFVLYREAKEEKKRKIDLSKV